MQSLLRITLAASLLLVSACQAQTQGDVGRASPISAAAVEADDAPSASAAANRPMTPAELARIVAVECPAAGNPSTCRAGGLNVELLPSCGETGFFAGVTSPDGVALQGSPALGEEEADRTRLAQGQLVCLQAIARVKQDPVAYFATAVRVEDVPLCRTGSLCEMYGERPIRWSGDASPQPGCRQIADGRFDGCAAGWLPASALEVFSNE